MNLDILKFELSPEFLEVHKSLTENDFNVSYTGVSTRMVNYYEKEGYLLNTDRKPRTKRRFNAIDIVWIKMIKYMFDYGFTKENVLFIKNWILDNQRVRLTKEEPIGYNVLEFHLSYIIAYKTDFRLIVQRYGGKEIFGVQLSSHSHGADFQTPSTSEFPSLVIPLVPILNSFWQYYTGKKIVLADRSLISIKGNDKELVNEIVKSKFVKLSIENKNQPSGKYVAVTNYISKEYLNKICLFLSKQKYTQVVLNYGAEIGKPISGTIVNHM